MTLTGLIAVASAAQAASGPWVQVSAGGFHTCAINTGKSLYCWGQNTNGQVGDGTNNNPSLSLHRVGAAGVWTKVSAGANHTCGITTAKNLYCWGYNDFGQVGDGTTDSPRLTLWRVGAAGVWTNVSAGGNHTCGITTAKNLYCWGLNDEGAVGDGTTNSPRKSPVRIAAAGVWTSVSTGGYHTCGITTAKNLYCWGKNSSSQVGDGTVNTPRKSPYRVAAAGVWTSVTAGNSHTCGITTAKNLYCWGYNTDGEAGDGGAQKPRKSLYRVAAAGVWTNVTAGGGHTCGVTTGRNLYCWGLNSSAQVGDGMTDNPHLPLYRVGAAGVWTSATAGGFHTCAINVGANLHCWGYNNAGQVGDGTTDNPSLDLFQVH